jgi:hypothetical protein
LFYADLVEPVDGFANVAAYLARLRARPSFARAVDEARPWRRFFPPGWPQGRGLRGGGSFFWSAKRLPSP